MTMHFSAKNPPHPEVLRSWAVNPAGLLMAFTSGTMALEDDPDLPTFVRTWQRLIPVRGMRDRLILSSVLTSTWLMRHGNPAPYYSAPPKVPG